MVVTSLRPEMAKVAWNHIKVQFAHPVAGIAFYSRKLPARNENGRFEGGLLTLMKIGNLS